METGNRLDIHFKLVAAVQAANRIWSRNFNAGATMRSIRHFTAAVTLLCAMALGCQQANNYQPAPPPAVTVAKPLVQDVTVFMEENGETEAVERAEVRARVQGFVEEVRFEPGKIVQEGQVLYVIEKIQYQATLDSFNASLAAAKASLSSAQSNSQSAKAAVVSADADLNVKQLEFERLDGLLASRAIAQRDWDDAKAQRDSAIAAKEAAVAQEQSYIAEVEKAQAQIQKAEADVNQAEIDLGYTDVKAPISGRITRTDIKRGNLVEDGTVMATIVANDPIWANFNISESDMLDLRRSNSRPEDENFDLKQFSAFLKRTGDDGFPYRGNLDYVDPEVDQATGTLGIRAIFQNSAVPPEIMPGMFVRVRVPIGTIENAVLIPEQAVGRDRVGTYVLTVDAKNIVERKNIELGTKEGNMVMVVNGLSPDETIVVVGVQRARPGAEVNPTSITLTPPAESTAASTQDDAE